ncbi:MAG TPA: phosphatase PAP2 family protein [Nitrospirota bacterium]|nr:phosphatase PAP2 family protein [Nitrospirota bacterium]
MTIQSLDTQFLLLINHGMANAFLDILMPALSLRGYLLVIPYILAMLLISANRRDREGRTFISTTVWALVIAFGAWYLSEWAEDALKVAIARERPCRELEHIRLILPCPKSFSMPSGHAITSFAVAAPLFYLPRAYIALIWRLYPVVLASFIAFSRLYLGVHYPTDVLAGTFLGILIGLAPSILYQVLATEEVVKRRKA